MRCALVAIPPTSQSGFFGLWLLSQALKDKVAAAGSKPPRVPAAREPCHNADWLEATPLSPRCCRWSVAAVMSIASPVSQLEAAR